MRRFTTRTRRWRRGVLLLASTALSACVSAPISRTVAPGSTIVIPLTGERSVALDVSFDYAAAYSYQLPGTPPVADPQRGALFALMCPHTMGNTLLACQQNGARKDLPIRYVTRLYPDPASQAGIDNLVQDLSRYSGLIPVSGQVLVFAEIPTSVNGDFPASCGGASPPQSCFDPLAYDVFVGLHRPPGAGPDETLVLNQWYDRRINVVRLSAASLASPTPNLPATLYLGAPAPDLPRFVPYPKCVFAVNAAGMDLVGAAELTIQFPSTVIVKDVIEEEHLGRHTMVRWQPNGSTAIHVELIAPDNAPGNPPGKSVNRIAVVFALSGGAAYVTPASFSVTASQLYDVNGDPLPSAGFSPEAIR